MAIIIMYMAIPSVIAPSARSSAGNIQRERPIETVWGDKIKVSNDSEASNLTGFIVRFPSKIPNGSNLQLAVVDPTIENNKYVFLFYSPHPITNTMTIHDFWAQKGIYIYYTKMSSALKDPNLLNTIISGHVHALQNYGNVDAHEVVINGHYGTIFNQRDREFQGSQIHDPSQLEFFIGSSDITIEAYLPDNALIDIAKSISSSPNKSK